MVMDLAYSAEYEQYRQHVRDFLESNRELWPGRVSLGLPTDEMKRWQAMLIEAGSSARKWATEAYTNGIPTWRRAGN